MSVGYKIKKVGCWHCGIPDSQIPPRSFLHFPILFLLSISAQWLTDWCRTCLFCNFNDFEIFLLKIVSIRKLARGNGRKRVGIFSENLTSYADLNPYFFKICRAGSSGSALRSPHRMIELYEYYIIIKPYNKVTLMTMQGCCQFSLVNRVQWETI